MNTLLHWTGGDNGSSPQYLELSGFLSIVIPVLITILWTGLLYWWHTRCHVTNCLRKGNHPFRHYKLCKKHHPRVPQDGRITHLHIVQLHKGKRNGTNARTR